MSKRRTAYPLEFRRQMVELVRSGRNPEELSREFEPTAQAIRNWVAQADRDEGRRSDGLTTAERQELGRLRRENRQLRIEREILSKAAVLGISTSGYLRVAESSALGTGAVRCRAERADPGTASALAWRLWGSPYPGRPAGGRRAGQPQAGGAPQRSADLVGISRRKGSQTTLRDRDARPAPDRVQRCFTAERPDRLWVADITYVPTLAGFLFLAVVMDVFSRRIWAGLWRPTCARSSSSMRSTWRSTSGGRRM